MTGPRFEVVPGRPEHRQVVKNLLQLYQYDFSEFAGGVVGEDGLFHYIDRLDEHFGQPGFHPFLLTVYDEDPQTNTSAWRPAGFAFVASATYFAPRPEPDQQLIAEFFVMRKYRRAGLGSALARHCFDAFPGRWEVGEVPSNLGAQAFWRRVIGEYTGGRFAEVTLDDDRWQGPVQTFDNSRHAPRPA